MHMFSLPPRERRTRSTGVGHVWVVRHAGKNKDKLLSFRARKSPTVYCVPPCREAGRFDGAAQTTVAYRNNSQTHPATVFWHKPSEGADNLSLEGATDLVKMQDVEPGGHVAVLDTFVGHSFVVEDESEEGR